MTNDEAAYFNPLLLDFRYSTKSEDEEDVPGAFGPGYVYNPAVFPALPQPDDERVLSVVRGDNGHINAFNNKCIHGVEGVQIDRKTGRQISPDCKMCLIG